MCASNAGEEYNAPGPSDIALRGRTNGIVRRPGVGGVRSDRGSTGLAALPAFT